MANQITNLWDPNRLTRPPPQKKSVPPKKIVVYNFDEFTFGGSILCDPVFMKSKLKQRLWK